MGTKINEALKSWRPGLVLTASYLKRNGLNYALQLQYQKSGWLKSIGNGAVKRAGDAVSWPGALHALQQQLKLPVHLGGKSALTQQGYAHYARVTEGKMYLFTVKNKRLPKWFLDYKWEQQPRITRTAFLPYDLNDSFITTHIDGFPLRLSSTERAVLELLYFVPKLQGFDEAMKIMASLTSLRPVLMQQLLAACTSVKVKRLFMYMAEKQNHFWFEHLDPRRIGLGSGKRSIIKNGVFDKKYRITVPREYET